MLQEVFADVEQLQEGPAAVEKQKKGRGRPKKHAT